MKGKERKGRKEPDVKYPLYLAQTRRLLQHRHVVTLSFQRNGRREAAEAAADDYDVADGVSHRVGA